MGWTNLTHVTSICYELRSSRNLLSNDFAKDIEREYELVHSLEVRTVPGVK